MKLRVPKGKSFRSRLIELRACGWADNTESVGWVGRRSLRTAWRLCDRGDWMLWLAAKVGVDRKLVVRAACDCARLALVHVPVGEERPRVAIETAEAWCEGRATLDEVKAAADTASAAADAAYAADANYRAVECAADAAAYAADAAAEAAADAASRVVATAANGDAADAACAAARHTTLAKCAELVRARIPVEVIAAAMERQSVAVGKRCT